MSQDAALMDAEFARLLAAYYACSGVPMHPETYREMMATLERDLVSAPMAPAMRVPFADWGIGWRGWLS